MKLNLLYGHGDHLQEYININPFALEETDNTRIADVKQLDSIVEDAEATEIIAADVVDYLSMEEINKALDHWISKMRHGARLVIGGCDSYDAAKALVQFEIDLETFNLLVHGTQDQPHLFKKMCLTLSGLCDYLEEKGLKIIKKRRNGLNYVVEAQRP
jgi:hypothetical protein